MRLFVVNSIAILMSLVLFFAYQFGALSASNAFFGAAVMMAVYTGFQLVQREGEPLLDALHDIFAKPEAYPRKTAYLSYVAVLGLGFVLVAQTVIA